MQTYLTHHNTYEESQHIHREYSARLLELDDDRYYQQIDRAYQTYRPLPARHYIPANQVPGPHRMTQELMQIFGKGRGQARREELHRHRPFGARTRSLQSERLRKHNVGDKGMRTLNNFFVQRLAMLIVNDAT